MIAWGYPLITWCCCLLNVSRMASWTAPWSLPLMSWCWEVFTAADPNGFAFNLQQKWPHTAPFLKHDHVWSGNQLVWNDHTFVVFLSLVLSITSFSFICSPLVELISVSFSKTLGPERLPLEAKKKITSIQTGFCVGSEISWKKSLDYVLCSSMLGWA